MKTTWFVVTGCIAAAAIAIGCGDSDGGGGSGGGEVTCADGSKSHAITTACKVDDECVDYRTELVDVAKQTCVDGGGEVVAKCPRPTGYLGSCLFACGTALETSMAYSTSTGFENVGQAKAACEFGSGIWFDSQGGGGSGGTGGTGGTGGNGDGSCTEASVPSALVGACENEGNFCIEYRGAGMPVAQIEQTCAGMGMTFRTTECPTGDDYLGRCLTACGQIGESSTAWYSMGGILTEEAMKADCDGKWYK